MIKWSNLNNFHYSFQANVIQKLNEIHKEKKKELLIKIDNYDYY